MKSWRHRLILFMPNLLRWQRKKVLGAALLTMSFVYIWCMSYNDEWPVIFDDVSMTSHFSDQYKSIKCPDVRRPLLQDVRMRNGHWQLHLASDHNNTEVLVYSTFYDDRDTANWTSYLRMLVVASTAPEVTLFCHVWYQNELPPYVVVAQQTRTGRLYHFGERNTTYRQLLLSCRLPVFDKVPSHVSIATSACGNSTVLSEVIQPIRETSTSNVPRFGICVAISFGTVPLSEFVEWVELNRLLGVSEINIYDGNMAATMNDVIEYYRKAEVIRLYRMPPPVLEQSVTGVKVSSPASLNDCMMRNMYRYEFILVIDFDELIVPRTHADYAAMLAYIDRKHNITVPHHTYGFRNVYYFRELKPDVTQPWYLRSAIYRRHVKVSPPGFAPKSFVDPRRCLSVFNHYCYILLPAVVNRKSLDVSAKVAASHHYRKCSFTSDICRKMFDDVTVDDVTLRFIKRLKPRVESILEDLGIIRQKELTGNSTL